MEARWDIFFARFSLVGALNADFKVRIGARVSPNPNPAPAPNPNPNPLTLTPTLSLTLTLTRTRTRTPPLPLCPNPDQRQSDAFLQSMGLTPPSFRALLGEAHQMMREEAEAERL